MAETAPAGDYGEDLWPNVGDTRSGNALTAPFDNCTYPYLQPNYWTIPDAIGTWTSYPSKVRLTLSEVEVLREAARKDEKVRAALEKFRHHIEIEVDFPGPEDGEDTK